jgi:hypothetical protein
MPYSTSDSTKAYLELKVFQGCSILCIYCPVKTGSKEGSDIPLDQDVHVVWFQKNKYNRKYLWKIEGVQDNSTMLLYKIYTYSTLI